MKYLWIAAVVAFCNVTALGQVGRAPAAREFPEYRVYPGTLDEDNFPVSGARLCTVGPKAHCFGLTPQGARFGLRATSKRVKLDGGGSVVLFNANCGGGSGSSDRYVLLRSEPDGQIKNLLPEIIVTNQADVAVWNLPTVSPMPLMLTADALWEDGAHYGAHFFEVRIYVYDSALDRYKLRRKYRTAHRYPGIDNWDSQPEVLEKERSRIIEVLGTQ